MQARVSGLNHVTLAVADVERSSAFYRDVLGCAVRAVWIDGAYLEAGQLWLCLSLDENARSSPRPDYSHIAFSVPDADYAAISERLHATCVIWKDNRSEAASTYFLDPDGHKLEMHLERLRRGCLTIGKIHLRESVSSTTDEGRTAAIVSSGQQPAGPFTTNHSHSQASPVSSEVTAPER